MNKITAKSFSKINLSLDIKGKRNDGYHLIESVLQSIDLCDVLEFELYDDIELLSDNKNIPLDRNNLIIKAAELLKKEFGGSGAIIKLKKNIPVAAGLAGGSSDAAATLLALNKLWSLNINKDTLTKFSLAIGADVPFCINGGTKFAEGIGDILKEIDFTKLNLLIVKPNISVSTKEVYQLYDKIPNIDNGFSRNMIDAIQRHNINDIASSLGNVLELVTAKKYPIIKSIKDLMIERGALNSLMSGSGPTVFGIFDNKTKLKLAYKSFIKDGFYASITKTVDKGVLISE